MGQNIKRARRQRQNQVLEHFRSILPSMRTTTIAICTLLLLSSSAWARESSSDVEIVDGRRLEKVKVATDADVAALAEKLTDLSALEKLETIKMSLDIEDNEALTSVALPGLKNVGMGVEIEENEKLTSVAFSGLTVGMNFKIKENDALTKLSLDVGDVGMSATIEDDALTSLDDVKFGSVGMSLTIKGESIASLDGLQVGSVGMDFEVDAPLV